MRSQKLMNKSKAEKNDQASHTRSVQKESSDPVKESHDPLENISCRIGDAGCAARHVSVIQRTGLFNPMNENRRVESLLGLQQQYGNRFVQRVIGQYRVQAKLKIGQPGDIYEQEADRIADQVMRMPDPGYKKEPVQTKPVSGQITRVIQRQPEEEEEEEEREEEEEVIWRKQAGEQQSKVTPTLETQVNSLKGGGQPLSPSVRNFFEPRFGYDFNQVRVHTDARAAESAQAVDARAYTVGRHVIFGPGQFSPGTTAGRLLLAHELTHTVQQGATVPHRSGLGRVQRLLIPTCRIRIPFLQRQCPISGVTFNIGPHPAHAPHCGTKSVVAQAQPAEIKNLTWSLLAGSAAVDPGTTIDAEGIITIAATQNAGTIRVRATRPPRGEEKWCDWTEPLVIVSHPTGITATSVVGPPPNPALNYGGTFDHVFTSHDGNVASLENVPVGERYPSVPNPTGAVHRNIPTPFGPFKLTTRTLTANATSNWFLNEAGELGGEHDKVTLKKAEANVGEFLQSASNPTPTHALPVSFTLDQDLYWYCRTAVPANRWTQFVRVQHTRGLRQNAGAVQFFTQVNLEERLEPYTGHPGIINARAVPNRVTRSPVGGPENTVTIRADTLPDRLPEGHALRFSIPDNKLGSDINPDTGVFIAGQTAGQVRVEVRDSQAANPNFDDTTVIIV